MSIRVFSHASFLSSLGLVVLTPILYEFFFLNLQSDFMGMIDTSAFQGKTASYYTLGCKLNFSETSTFAELLQGMGVRTVQCGEPADICLINTCSVTEVADHKCRQAIRRMVRENPGAFVIVTGCYAQLESQTVSQIEGVDLVLGSNEKANLVQYLNDAWLQKSELS